MPFLLAHRVGIDSRGGELCMAEPALYEVERNALFDTGDAKAMPQPFGTRLGARDAGPCHDLNDAGVRGFQTPRPELRPGGTVAEAMHQIERIQERGRDWHSAVEAGAAFLLALKREDGRLEIHLVGGQGQGL